MKYSTNPDQQGLYRGAGSRRIYMFYDLDSNLAAAVKKSQPTHCWLLASDCVAKCRLRWTYLYWCFSSNQRSWVIDAPTYLAPAAISLHNNQHMAHRARKEFQPHWKATRWGLVRHGCVPATRSSSNSGSNTPCYGGQAFKTRVVAKHSAVTYRAKQLPYVASGHLVLL